MKFPEDGDRTEIEAIFYHYGPSMIFFSTAVIVLLEIFIPTVVFITWKVVALIALLLVAPFLRDIKRVWIPNLGGVDLQEDIDATQELVSKLKEEFDNKEEEQDESENPEDESRSTELDNEDPEVDDLGGDVDEISSEIYSLLDDSPRAALAMLRMETEEAVRDFMEKKGAAYEGRKTNTKDMYNFIRNSEDLDREFVHAFEEVRELCNRAIHGEEIRIDSAVDIVEMGLYLLNYLEDIEDKN